MELERLKGLEVDPTRLFRFSFKSPDANDNLAHFVLTDDIRKMVLFLKQHNFDPRYINIEVVRAEDHEGDSEFLLERFLLRSNYSQETFHIMTTEHMVYECSDYTSSIISSSLIFGLQVTRTDELPVMGVISDLVNELDHVYVLDHTLKDPVTGQPYSSDYERYTKTGYPVMHSAKFDMYYDECSYDDGELIESMQACICRDTPLPFTLEAYTSYFISLLTDKYT